VAHAVQVSVVALQIGVVPEQLALVRHCTHLFVVVSQTDVAPEQVELSVHCTHAPVTEHAGCVASTAAHWLAKVQPAQVCVVALQMGATPEQLAPVKHWTHLFVVVSHTGVVPEHVELSVHCTQAPAAEHTGQLASMVPHWVEVVQAVHTPLAAHTGAVTGQVALVRHPTQAPPVEQSVRAGSFKAARGADVVQAVHAPAAQIGVAAGQVALVRHATQAPAVEQSVRAESFKAAH
jgi:hypothetical protein